MVALQRHPRRINIFISQVHWIPTNDSLTLGFSAGRKQAIEHPIIAGA